LDFDEQTLYINTSTNKVAIGTNAPVTDLTIEGPITIKEQADADADTAAYGQIWVNTATPNQLYFTTDAGDDVQITDGTALAGAFDTDAAQVFNESGADVDFRIESDDNANMIFVDGGNDRVGIGTSAPGALLDVRGPVGTGATGAGVLRLSTAELTVVDADQLGRIEFIAPLESSGTDAILVGASIYAEADNTFAADNNNTDLVFATGASEAATEKMRVQSTGSVGIGDVQASSALGFSGPVLSIKGTGPALMLNSTNTGDPKWEIGAHPSESLYLTDDGNARMIIDSSGRIGFGVTPNAAAHITLGGALASGGFYPNTGSDEDHTLFNMEGLTNGRKFYWDQSEGGYALGARLIIVGASAESPAIEFSPNALSAQWRLYSHSSTYNMYWYDIANTDNQIRIDTSTGTHHAEGGHSTTAVDYAEYFESTDGQAIAWGTTVVLEGSKVKPASEGETPLGVIRPPSTSSTVGGTAELRWKRKYLRGEHGEQLYNEDDGKKTLNPDFDPDIEYVPRSEREEWNIVGLLGQIEITKGQPIGSNWIKMGDISDSVEMYFVK
jgi:hypothetical protein